MRKLHGNQHDYKSDKHEAKLTEGTTLLREKKKSRKRAEPAEMFKE